MIFYVVNILLISVPKGHLLNSEDVFSTTLRSTTDQSTAGSTTDQSTAGSTTDHSEAQSTPYKSTTGSATDHSKAKSITYTAGSEYTSQSQTASQLHSHTTEQTTHKTVTERNQIASQSTLQPQSATELKTSESLILFPTGQKNTTSNPALLDKYGKIVAGNPGLTTVLCIFFITLAFLLVTLIVKAIRIRGPQFERLDDVPMSQISEDAPFAHYPPK